MNPIRPVAMSLLAFSFVSCASNHATPPDTASPYGTADAGQVSAPVTQSANPVYDTPAAYEESGTTATGGTTATATSPSVPTSTNQKTPAPAISKPASNGAAIIHTVVAGDTLSGISAKYKVSAAAIKQANGMTKDTVVLGRKIVIPPVH